MRVAIGNHGPQAGGSDRRRRLFSTWRARREPGRLVPRGLGHGEHDGGITDGSPCERPSPQFLGSSLAEAEAIMKAEGFDCSFGYNTTANQDYLRCTRTDAESLLVSHRWIVNFTYSDGRTTGMEVRTGLLGL
jgi:hypothetical protein